MRSFFLSTENFSSIDSCVAGTSDGSPSPKKTNGSKKFKDDANCERMLLKKQKQAEAARLRYHRLNPDEKKALNLKRTQAQKRKRQRERELAELESILRSSNDIIDDPLITEQLREKRIRARWAEAARTRYQRMSSEERRAHNVKRRMRQMNVKDDLGEAVNDPDVVRDRIKEQNARKALAARTRYHRMSNDEKRQYNQRRTEAFRKRRLEEEALLAMPIGKINGEALDRAQQIVVRNAKRAEAARLRYQRMTPQERKAYNQKRYVPKRKRDESKEPFDSVVKTEEVDALTSLERDVMRRTEQAQEVIRQRNGNGPPGPSETPEPPKLVTFTLPFQNRLPATVIATQQQMGFQPAGTIMVQQSPVDCKFNT